MIQPPDWTLQLNWIFKAKSNIYCNLLDTFWYFDNHWIITLGLYYNFYSHMIVQGREVSRTKCSHFDGISFWTKSNLRSQSSINIHSLGAKIINLIFSKCARIYLTMSVDTEPFYTTQDYKFPKVEPRHLLGIVSKISTLFGLCLICVFKGENY